MKAVQLNIAKPCHENWDAMTPNEKGKFCSSCQKTVVDFTLMSDGELLRYLSSIKEKSICGNLYTDQLNRPILMPKEPTKPLPWYWSFIMMVSLFFTKSLVKAQSVKGEVNTRPIKENVLLRGKVKCVRPVNKDIIPNNIVEQPLDTLVNDTVVVTGHVSRPQPITMGAVAIIESPKLPLYIVDGVVEESILGLDSSDIKSVDILKEAPSVGYHRSIYSEVIIITTKKATEQFKKTARFFSDTLKNITNIQNDKIKIYPNPIKAGERISVAFKLKSIGIFNITITNYAGETVLQQKINMNSENQIQSLETLSAWSGGMYFIRIIDSKNKLISTSRFIVE